MRQSYSSKELHKFYQKHLLEQLLPFWNKAVDTRQGGVFTGFNAAGTELLHKDKFTWSQGRFLWVWSRIAAMGTKGLLPVDVDAYRQEADKTYQFLTAHALMPEGGCYFLLDEFGQPKEMVEGQGHDISFYADCFVIMGFAEYACLTKKKEAFELAVHLYEQVEQRLEAGTARSVPYDVPSGLEVHGYAMIVLNTLQSLIAAAQTLAQNEYVKEFKRKALHKCNYILDVLMNEQGLLREVFAPSDHKLAEAANEKLLLRHFNPGHSVECLWFVMTEVLEQGETQLIERAAAALKAVLQAGWDEEYGGLFRYLDLADGEPHGDSIAGAEAFEALIRETWDMKLWWPHSEGLYAARLAYIVTGDAAFLDWYNRLHDYTFRVFPAAAGQEWIQIRDRAGAPAERNVALPVKDPYHIMRNVLLMIELTK